MWWRDQSQSQSQRREHHVRKEKESRLENRYRQLGLVRGRPRNDQWSRLSTRSSRQCHPGLGRDYHQRSTVTKSESYFYIVSLCDDAHGHNSVESGRLVFVDAQAVEAAQAHAQSQGRSILPPESTEDDKEMAAFQSMLQEYLSRGFFPSSLRPVASPSTDTVQWKGQILPYRQSTISLPQR